MSEMRAVAFDLDGTLVQTERLKAKAYAEAAAELRPGVVSVEDVLRSYPPLVGRSREQVVRALMDEFHLEDAARARMAELDVDTPDEAFATMRLRGYEAMLADHALIRRRGFPETLHLLERVHALGYRTGVGTTSHREQARTVLAVLGVLDDLDALVTREDVERPKPDPEMYRLLARRLDTSPGEMLVVEDSVPGIESALAAGTRCVAVPNELTRESVHAAQLLPPDLVVDDRERLAGVVLRLLHRDVPPDRGLAR